MDSFGGVSVFNPQSAFVRAVGSPGSAAGQLASPRDVAVDAVGNLYVADFLNNRISVLSEQGPFIRAFGFDVIPGGGGGFEICTTSTSCKAGVFGSGTGQLDAPNGVATDCRGAVYVVEANNDRIARFGEPGTALPPCPPPDPIPVPLPPPSNEFTIGKLKRNTKKGTAKLTVELPGAGALALAGKSVKGQTKQADAAGALKLAVKAVGKGKRKLADSGKLKLRLSLTFTPTGGEPSTQTKRSKLKRRR